MSSAIWGAAVVRVGRAAKRSDKEGIRRYVDARARSHSANFGSPRIICASWRADTCPPRMHSSKREYSTSMSLLAMAYTTHCQTLKDVRRSNALDNPSRWLPRLGVTLLAGAGARMARSGLVLQKDPRGRCGCGPFWVLIYS